MAKSFEGADKYRRIRDVGDRLSVILKELKELDPHRQYKETIEKFNEHTAIIKDFVDEGSLPWLSRDGFSRGFNVLSCLYALISQTILLYWDLQKGKEIDDELLDQRMDFLEVVAKHGLKRACVVGHYPNYELGITGYLNDNRRYSRTYRLAY